MDDLENLDDGLAPTLLRRAALLDRLDDGLAVDADDHALTSGPTFFLPEAPGSPVLFEAPPVTFLVLMVLVGATAAALVFHRQVAQLF